MFYKCCFKGEEALVLENHSLRVTILPRIGGKVASFYHKSKDFELLFQNRQPSYAKANLYDDFSQFDASGFDDAFPCIDPGAVSLKGKDVLYPDHGEIWSGEFECKKHDEHTVDLYYKSKILSYTYYKQLSLEDECLRINYKIKNTGIDPFPCIWTMHCLIRCEKDMELLFPKYTERIENALDSTRLGAKGTVHSFPITKSIAGESYMLNRILPATANHMEKYYVKGRVSEGRCGAYYPAENITFTVSYDKELLPYLGFWITEGGFRGDYNCAMEPSNGYYDSIEVAKCNNAVYHLKPGEMLDFNLDLSLK